MAQLFWSTWATQKQQPTAHGRFSLFVTRERPATLHRNNILVVLAPTLVQISMPLAVHSIFHLLPTNHPVSQRANNLSNRDYLIFHLCKKYWLKNPLRIIQKRTPR